MSSIFDLVTVQMDEEANAVVILDQTQLPEKEVYLRLKTPEEIWEAIYLLKVRGAPAIGVTAAYGLAVCARALTENDPKAFGLEVRRIRDYLATARPTAVNLFTALDRMMNCLRTTSEISVEELKTCLLREALAIREEDAAACRQIGEWGLSLLTPGMGLLTHCNAGHLAVSAYGTALAPIYLGQEKGFHFRVFADETRPLLQGARLTAYELQKAGVDITLICDNMASAIMQKGWVQAVLVGCDRIAANGDVANKIGTSGVAVLARYYGIPFYVLGPTSTFDAACPNGEAIPVEERPVEEITEKWYARRMAPADVNVYNPAFDVTPQELITAIVTEKGIVYPPFDQGFRKLLAF